LRNLLLVLLFLFCTGVSGQKVALVLSGGGAKGVSHIGVIKALEEARIPINYIAGTSMGAIIGGLYAAGYTPAEMETIISSKEFETWISGKIDPKYTYYFRKPYPDASWLTFKFKVDSANFQTQLPTNIVSPVLMDFAFQEIFGGAAAASKNNFDSLFVPFRCVASDIYNSKALILRSGDLGSAIRASATFPFYLKPIRIDGKLLFDGGMYNNFPVDIALKDFDPDIIIGSKASGNYDAPKDDNIMSQVTSMLMERTSYEMPCSNSVLIVPDLKPVNVIDFSNTKEFIDSGYMAATRQIPRIRQFVLDSVNPDQLMLKRDVFKSRKPPYIIDSIDFAGLNKGQRDYINKMIRNNGVVSDRPTHEKTLPTLQEFKGDYFRLLAEGRIINAYPRLHYNSETGRYTMRVLSNQDNKFSADFGGNISSKATNEVFLQLRYNYWNNIAATITTNTYLGRFYNSFRLGGIAEFPSQVPFYIEASFSVNQFNYMQTTNTYFVNNTTPVYLKQKELFAESRIGFPLSTRNKMEMAIDWGTNRYSYYQTNLFTDKDTLDNTNFNYFSPAILFEINTLNQKQYANSGEHFLIASRFVSGTEEYSPGSTSIIKVKKENLQQYLQAKILYETYFKTRGFYTPGILIESYLTTNHLFSNYISSLLANSQFSPVPEMMLEFLSKYRNSGYIAAGYRNIFKLRKKIDLRIEGYAFTPVRQIISMPEMTAVYGKSFKTISLIGSTSVVYQSPIGPISISANYYPAENSPISLFVNFGYILFNRLGLE
jgi:NTE family protein